MPVKKTSASQAKSVDVPMDTTSTTPDMMSSRMHHPCHPHMRSMCGHHFGKKILMTLFGILLVYLIVYFGTLIRNEMQEFFFIGKAPQMEHSIMIEADGSVDVTPNIAQLQMGVLSEAQTVAQAQEDNTTKMNILIERLKALDISADDIQTNNYNVYPRYDYTSEGQELRGYSVSQRIHIRIRDLDKADKVVALAGELEINDVGDLSYSVDERGAYIDQAREKAMKEVRKKAQALSQALGVRFVSVSSYNEYENSGPNVMYAMKTMEDALGGGLGSVPDLQPGTDKVQLHVAIGFEIR